MNRAAIATQAESHSGFVSRYDRTIKWFAAALIVLSLLLFARSLPLDRFIAAMKEWIGSLGAVGLFVFGLVYIVATVALMPASLLTIAAGAMFGFWKALAVVSLSSTIGAALAFLIARYLARNRISRQIQQYPKFRAIDEAIGREGWKIAALLRLSPLVPFNLQNYLYGLTSIRFWPCVLTSWVTMLPGTFMYVYIGYLGGTGLEAAGADRSVNIGQWLLRIMGFAATVAVTVYITRLARKTLAAKASLEEQPPGDQAADTVANLRTIDIKPSRSVTILAVAAILAAAAVWTYFRQDAIRAFIESRLPAQSTTDSLGTRRE